MCIYVYTHRFSFIPFFSFLARITLKEILIRKVLLSRLIDRKLDLLTGGPGRPGGPIKPGGPMSPYSPFSPFGPD